MQDDILRHCIGQGQELLARIADLDGRDLRVAEVLQRVLAGEGDLIAGKERLKAPCLGVRKPHEHLIRRRLVHHLEMDAMHVDRVVVRRRQDAVAHADSPLHMLK